MLNQFVCCLTFHLVFVPSLPSPPSFGRILETCKDLQETSVLIAAGQTVFLLFANVFSFSLHRSMSDSKYKARSSLDSLPSFSLLKV